MMSNAVREGVAIAWQPGQGRFSLEDELEHQPAANTWLIASAYTGLSSEFIFQNWPVPEAWQSMENPASPTSDAHRRGLKRRAGRTPLPTIHGGILINSADLGSKDGILRNGCEHLLLYTCAQRRVKWRLTLKFGKHQRSNRCSDQGADPKLRGSGGLTCAQMAK
jgi:hypothetical protein